ncbi:hypothetical protein IWW50_005376, partial [Coemansia erecta]
RLRLELGHRGRRAPHRPPARFGRVQGRPEPHLEPGIAQLRQCCAQAVDAQHGPVCHHTREALARPPQPRRRQARPHWKPDVAGRRHATGKGQRPGPPFGRRCKPQRAAAKHPRPLWAPAREAGFHVQDQVGFRMLLVQQRL